MKVMDLAGLILTPEETDVSLVTCLACRAGFDQRGATRSFGGAVG